MHGIEDNLENSEVNPPPEVRHAAQLAALVDCGRGSSDQDKIII